MKKVITYGTFDLLHQGHINLLNRAKAQGDYLIVGVTSDSFDHDRGKLNVKNNVLERVEAVKATGIADKVIIEDYVGQKIDDIQKYNVDIFTIGSDWEGKFDYLKEYCRVVYLPRTEGISSTLLREREQQIIKIGIVGTGRISCRFVPESRFVAGVELCSVYNPDEVAAKKFATDNNIPRSFNDYDDFLYSVDAVYIASPHLFHFQQVKRALLRNKHVLCEIPLVLKAEEAKDLYSIARQHQLVLLEASKTAFTPAFTRLISLVKSGIIGNVVDVKASLSKLIIGQNLRELEKQNAGGCITELSHFPLLAIIKLLGRKYQDISFYSKIDRGIDIFTKGIINYPGAVSSITLGLGVKTEGNLVISGTKGYIYVPAPWWKTDFFEVRFEDRNLNKKYFYPFEGEGLRYEIQEFASMIINQRLSSYKLLEAESIVIAQIIEYYRNGNFKILK